MTLKIAQQYGICMDSFLTSMPSLSISGAFADVADTYSEALDCPIDYVMGAQLAAVSAALGTKLHIKGRYDNWPCLWIALVGRSGSNKSAPVERILRPLREADALAAQAAGNDEAPAENLRRIFIGDSTHTALREALRDNPQGLLLYRDELTGFLTELGNESSSVAISELLTMYNQGQLVVDRHRQPPFVVPRPYLTILGGIQPRLLPDTFGNPSLADSGFTQRFLFVTGYRKMKRTPGTDYTEKLAHADRLWNDFIAHCLTLPPVTLELSARSKRLYEMYYDDISKSRRLERSDFMASVYSKMLINVIRVAAIAQVVCDYNNRCHSGEITEACLHYAVGCMLYFEATARRVNRVLQGGSFLS